MSLPRLAFSPPPRQGRHNALPNQDGVGLGEVRLARPPRGCAHAARPADLPGLAATGLRREHLALQTSILRTILTSEGQGEEDMEAVGGRNGAGSKESQPAQTMMQNKE